MLAEDRIDKDVVLDVLRRHLQEVLLAINTTADQAAAGRVPPATPVGLADISFDDLLGVPPENREREFMKKYFTEIRHRVISTDSTDHHDPQAADASLSIHTHSAQQREQTARQQRQQEQEDPEKKKQQHEPPASGSGPISGPGSEIPGPRPESAAARLPRVSTTATTTTTTAAVAGMGLGSRVGTMQLPRRASTWGTTLGNAFEVRRNNIWCTLVFRMLCWLLLHDFDKKDIQLSKNELMGNRLPVYIM